MKPGDVITRKCPNCKIKRSGSIRPTLKVEGKFGWQCISCKMVHWIKREGSEMGAVQGFIRDIKSEPKQRESVMFLTLYAKYSAAKFKKSPNEQDNLSKLIELATDLKLRFNQDEELAKSFVDEITKMRNGAKSRALNSLSKADWHMFYKTDEAVRWLADFLSLENK